MRREEEVSFFLCVCFNDFESRRVDWGEVGGIFHSSHK